MRPDARHLSSLRDALASDAKALVDFWPLVDHLARTGPGGREESGPGQKNRVSDPTGDAALRPNRYRQWSVSAARISRDLQDLVDQARTWVGGDPLPACPCGHPILPGVAKVANGTKWHEACYRRDLRSRNSGARPLNGDVTRA